MRTSLASTKPRRWSSVEKRITIAAKENVWWHFKQELNQDDSDKLNRTLKEAGFYRIDAGDCYAFLSLDAWDQDKAYGEYGADILQKVQSRGWFPHNLSIQFEYGQFLKKNKLELEWFVNWVEFRLGKQVANAVSPYRE